jgi:hypothetical protein
MWTNYASRVAFVAMLVAYGATLAVGWSYAAAIPGVSPDRQQAVLTSAAALALVAWPVWLLHWRWARNDWLWESEQAQYHLAFFTVVGLAASVVVAEQLIARVLNVLAGAAGTWADNRAFLFGATWSLVFSLGVWAFHGLTWLKYRRRKTAAAAKP